MTIRFEPLSRRHDRDAFISGVHALDDWFRTRATQDQRRHGAQVFVALDEQGIVGFYSMFTLALDSLPESLARKLPRYDAIPRGESSAGWLPTSVRGARVSAISSSPTL